MLILNYKIILLLNTEGIKNSKIYNSIPKELAREKSNVFKYSIVDKDARKLDMKVV